MTPRDYIASVKNSNCVICRNRLGREEFPCDAHHVGAGEDRSDWAVVALCAEHHRGATGVHGMHRRAFYSFWKTSDVQLLAWTNQELAR